MKRIATSALCALLALVFLLTAVACGVTVTPDTGDNGGDSGLPNGTVATNYGIGYGYDVINSPYFYSSQVKKSSILDLDKAMALIQKTQESSSKSGSIYSESIADYASQYEEKIGLGMKMGADFSAFTNGLGLNFDISLDTFKDTTFKSTEHQIFYTYFDNINSFYLEMKNYSIDSLRSMLSAQFLAAINRETSETRNLSDRELAAYLMNQFGTHLITGVQLGGRIEYSYLINTTSSQSANDIKIALQSKFGGNYSVVNGEFNLDASTALNEKLSQQGVEKSITIRRFGGSSVGLWTEEQIMTNYEEWAKSLNDERYMNAVGIAPQGVVALWSILPEDPKYASLVTEMQNFFTLNGLKVYESNIEKYVPVSSDTIVVDLTPCYDNLNKTVDYSKLTHPFFNRATGVFSINGMEGGEPVNKYIFRGAYGLQDDTGRTIDVVLPNFALEIYSEHDIEIELKNMAFRAPEGKHALASREDGNVENIKVHLTLSGNTEIYGGDGGKTSIDGGAAIAIHNLTLDIEAPVKIRGGNGGVNDGRGGDGGGGLGAVNLTINLPYEQAVNVTYLDIKGGDGENAADGNGANGGNGGNALGAQFLTINNLYSGFEFAALIEGGKGGNGGVGKAGANGTDAAWFGASATDGQPGEKGGKGGDGGTALLCETLTLKGIKPIFLRGGNSGKGGNGGKGGDGGKPVVPTVKTSGGNGGTGGDSGAAGDALIGTVAEGESLIGSANGVALGKGGSGQAGTGKQG